MKLFKETFFILYKCLLIRTKHTFERRKEMTIHEASERYNIPLDVLHEYERWGLCGAVKKVMGAWQYDDTDLERLSMIMTFYMISVFENLRDRKLHETSSGTGRERRPPAPYASTLNRYLLRITAKALSAQDIIIEFAFSYLKSNVTF